MKKLSIKMYFLLMMIVAFLFCLLCTKTVCAAEDEGLTVSTDDEFEIIDGVLQKYNGKAEKVIIPDGVKEIGKGAFINNSNIRIMYIPDSVKKIGNQAFRGCYRICRIRLPKELDYLEHSAFMSLSNLELMVLPSGIKEIDECEVSFSDAMKYIVVPEGVEKIGVQSFARNPQLSVLVLPDSVTDISDDALHRSGTDVSKKSVVGDKNNKVITALAENNGYSFIEKGLTKKLVFDESFAEITVKDSEGNVLSEGNAIKTGDLIFISGRTFSDDRTLRITVNGEVINYPDKGILYNSIYDLNHNVKESNDIPYIVTDDTIISAVGTELLSLNESINAYAETRIFQTGSARATLFQGLSMAEMISYKDGIVTHVNISKESYLTFDYAMQITSYDTPELYISIGDKRLSVPYSSKITQGAYLLPKGEYDIKWGKEKNGKVLICDVKISDVPDDIVPKAISINERILDLKIGSTGSITYSMIPEFYCGLPVEVKSSDPSIVSVVKQEFGKIDLKGISRGSSVITVTCEGNISYIVVYVSKYEIVDGYEFDGKILKGSFNNENSILLPEKAEIVASHAFEGHNEIEEIVVNDSYNTISAYAFYEASNIKRIYIPDSVTYIGRNAIPLNPNIIVCCTLNSTAYDYANEKGYDIYLLEDEHEIDNQFSYDDAIKTTGEEKIPEMKEVLNGSGKEVSVSVDLSYTYFYKGSKLYRYKVAENSFEKTPIYTASKTIYDTMVRGSVIYMYLCDSSSEGITIVGYDVFLDRVVLNQAISAEYTNKYCGFAVDDEKNIYLSSGIDLFVLNSEGKLIDKRTESDRKLLPNFDCIIIEGISEDGKLLNVTFQDVKGNHFLRMEDKPFTDMASAIAMTGTYPHVYAFIPIRNGKFSYQDYVINTSEFTGFCDFTYLRGIPWAMSATGVLFKYEDSNDNYTGTIYKYKERFPGRSIYSTTAPPAVTNNGIIYTVSDSTYVMEYDTVKEDIVGTHEINGTIQNVYATEDGIYVRYTREKENYIALVDGFEERKTIIRKQHITLTYTKDEVFEHYQEAQNDVDYSLSENVFSDEPSYESPYRAGKLSEKTVNDTLKLINYARWQYGINPVSIYSDYMDRSQKGAVILAATNTLTHGPYKPSDMDNDFYLDAKAGVSAGVGYSGNISKGDTIDDAVFGYLNELGNVNKGIGHRLSFLGLENDKTSFGYCNGYTAFSMYNADNASLLGNNEEFYAWPSAGYFPSESIDINAEWHIITDWYRNKGTVITFNYDGVDYTTELSSFDQNTDAFGFMLPEELKKKLTCNGESSKILDGAEVTVTLSGLRDRIGNDIVVTYPVKFVQVEPVELNHSFGKGIVTKEVTCTEDGIITYTCTGCGEVFEEIVKSEGHDEVITKGKEPTCTEYGYTEGITCSRCNEVIKEVTELLPLGHKTVIVPGKSPTCVEEGYSEYSYCEKCGIVFSEKVTRNALGHRYGEGVITKAPTETESGEMTYTCLVCEETKTERVLPLLSDEPLFVMDIGIIPTQMMVGDSFILNPSFSRVFTDSDSFEWKAITQDRIEIDDTGILTAKSAGEAEFTYELNGSNPEESIKIKIFVKPETPKAPVVKRVTDTAVIFDETDGLEYTIDGVEWFENEVRGLTPDTGYTVYARYKEDGYFLVSDISEGTHVHTDKMWPFNDVKPTDALADEIRFAFDRDIISGYGNPDENGQVAFKPANDVRRVQFAIMIYNMAGRPEFEVDGVQGFNDISEGDVGYTEVLWASSNNIINGFDDGNFKPTKKISRSQIAIMLYKYAEWRGYLEEYEVDETNLMGFGDYADIKAGARPYLSWAVDVGILTGNTKNKVVPNGNTRRDQCAAFFARFYKQYLEE